MNLFMSGSYKQINKTNSVLDTQESWNPNWYLILKNLNIFIKILKIKNKVWKINKIFDTSIFQISNLTSHILIKGKYLAM